MPVSTLLSGLSSGAKNEWLISPADAPIAAHQLTLLPLEQHLRLDPSIDPSICKVQGGSSMLTFRHKQRNVVFKVPSASQGT